MGLEYHKPGAFGRLFSRSRTFSSLGLVCLLLVAGLGCKPRSVQGAKAQTPSAAEDKNPSTKKSAAQAPASSEGQAPDAAAVMSQGDKPATGTQGPTPQQGSAQLAAALRAYGLGRPGAALLPEDYSLGPLQDLRAADKEEAAILARVTSFMDQYARGSVEPEFFAPESREALSLLIKPPAPKDKALPYRLGKIMIEGTAASLRLRLPWLRDSQPEEGLLSLGRRDSTWYIEGLTMDHDTETELRFDPGRRALRSLRR